MSNLMKILGFILALIGLGLAARMLSAPGSMDAWGIRLDTAALLFVGGILAVGLGAVADALAQRASTPPAIVPSAPPEIRAVVAKGAEASSKMTAAATGAVAGAAATMAAAKPDSVQDTINALSQAKADVLKSMKNLSEPEAEPEKPKPKAKAEAPAPQVADEEPEEDEEELYVVEEKKIRGLEARVLSDGTIEAETEEGWMRFENLEHLNEYLDA